MAARPTPRAGHDQAIETTQVVLQPHVAVVAPLLVDHAVKRVGGVPDALRRWAKQQQVDTGKRPGTTASDAATTKALQAGLRGFRLRPCWRSGRVTSTQPHGSPSESATPTTGMTSLDKPWRAWGPADTRSGQPARRVPPRRLRRPLFLTSRRHSLGRTTVEVAQPGMATSNRAIERTNAGQPLVAAGRPAQTRNRQR